MCLKLSGQRAINVTDLYDVRLKQRSASMFYHSGVFKLKKFNIYDLLKVAVCFIMAGGGGLPSF